MTSLIKKTAIFFLAIILAFILIMISIEIVAQLKKDQMEDLETDSNNDVIKIGLSLGTLKEERWIKDSELLQAKAAEYGVEVIVLNANNDDQDQLNQVEYLIKQDIDVLLIVPNDYNKATEAVKMAKSKSIPVISYDRLVLNANVDLYISFDNFKVGELLAQKVVNTPGVQNVLIINGAKTDYNTHMIKEGYDKVLDPLFESGEMTLLSENWTNNWIKEFAFNYTESAIRSGTKIDAILAANDSLAEAVIEALSEYRLTGEVTVVGQDADLTACQRIVEGTQAMTIYKPIEQLVDSALRMAIRLAKHEPLGINRTINDGEYDVDYLVLDPIPVDIDNIEETVIEDGFHLREDVYRNK